MGETKQRRPGIKHDVEFICGRVSTARQRPRPTKHKDLLLYCYSTVKASFAHPRVPGGVTRRGGNRRSNQRGFVILTPYILCSNCCCHQFNYVGLQPTTLSCNNTPTAMISTHLPVKPSRRRPQHHLRLHLDSCTNPFTSY